MTAIPRKDVASYGARGAQVRVFIERGGSLVRVQWRERGAVKTKSWANTPANVKDAKVWAKAFAEARERPDVVTERPRITIREMWEAYQLAEFPHLRATTKRNYTDRWTDWERFAGRNLIAELTTLEMLDRYRDQRTRLGLAVAQTGEHIKVVKQVYAWAQRRDLIARNRVALYRFKIAKEARTESPGEYRTAEFERILGYFDPKNPREWRSWAVLTLCGTQGPRVNAALQLRWEDVDFDANDGAGTIRWRADTDKVGRARVQPLTTAARDALWVAYGYALREAARSGRSFPWVFYSPNRRHWTGEGRAIRVQGVWQALRDAEDAAGITHAPRRAAHGLRRMAAGNALELTGNIADAMWWIGDTDLRQGKKYLKERDDRMREVAEGMPGTPEPLPNPANQLVTGPQPAPETATAPVEAGAVSEPQSTTYEND